MNRNLILSIGLFITVVIGGASYLFLQEQNGPVDTAPSAAPPIQTGLEGKAAPDFSLKRLDGSQVSLSDYRGKVVFLNFWATWCDPCKEEMPSMERLYQTLKKEPFELLAVSLDQGNHQQQIKKFTDTNKITLTFPILHDPGELTAKNSYRTTGVPESFIIDAEGNVVKHVIGMYQWDSPAIVDYFKKLIKKIPAS